MSKMLRGIMIALAAAGLMALAPATGFARPSLR